MYLGSRFDRGVLLRITSFRICSRRPALTSKRDTYKEASEEDITKSAQVAPLSSRLATAL